MKKKTDHAFDNIGLGFDSVAGFLHAYPFPGVERGCRIFDLNENDTSSFRTQMIYSSQLIERKASLLQKTVTHGNFNKAINFLKTTMLPRFLQKFIGKKNTEIGNEKFFVLNK